MNFCSISMKTLLSDHSLINIHIIINIFQQSAARNAIMEEIVPLREYVVAQEDYSMDLVAKMVIRYHHDRQMLFYYSVYSTLSADYIILAICNPRCENGGNCVSPGVCSCPVGLFTGLLCRDRKFNIFPLYTFPHSGLNVIYSVFSFF